MAVAKVIVNGVTKIDLTDDTVVASKLAYGYTATGADGVEITGTMEETTSLTAQQIATAVQAGWI